MACYSPPIEKPDIMENGIANSSDRSGKVKINHGNGVEPFSRVNLESFSHIYEKKILRKMNIRLIPMLVVLYLPSFLDGGNIGNANFEGLQKDPKMLPD